MQYSLQALIVAERVKKSNDKTETTTRVWRITGGGEGTWGIWDGGHRKQGTVWFRW